MADENPIERIERKLDEALRLADEIKKNPNSLSAHASQDEKKQALMDATKTLLEASTDPRVDLRGLIRSCLQIVDASSSTLDKIKRG